MQEKGQTPGIADCSEDGAAGGAISPAPTADRFSRLLAESTRDVLLVYCPDRTLQWVSPSIEAALGIAPQTVVGTSERLVHRDDFPLFEERYAEALRDHLDHVRARVRIPHADGHVLWFDASISFVWEPGGRLLNTLVSLRDVTAEVVAQRSLAASERRFRTAMADSAIGMAIVGPDGAFLNVNRAMCTFFGVSAEELVTKTWQELTHPYDLGNDLAALRRLLSGEADHYRITKRYLKADGTVLVGDLTVSAIREDDGTLSHLVSQIVDMTEQTRVQQELAQSEQHFRLLADNASDVVVRSTNDGVMQWLSKSVTRVLGWQPDELTGRRFVDLVHPEDVATVKLVQKGVRGGEQGKFEARIRDSAGHHRWFSVTVSPIRGSNGVMTGRVSSWRDVDSEVKARELAAAREAEFRLLAEHASDLVLRVGRDDRIEWVSPSAASSLGWWPDEMVGQPAVDFLDPVDLERYQSLVADLHPQQPARASGRLRCADGRYRWFAGIATRIVDRQGNDLGRIVGLRDIDADVQSLESVDTTETGLRAAMASAPAGMAIVDLNRKFVHVNDALVDLVGHDRGWFLAHGVEDLLSEADNAADLSMREHVLAGDPPAIVLERSIRLADGSTRWVLHSVGVLRDEHDEPKAFFSQFVDIDQAKQTRTDLEFLATHDALTRLPNRRALLARLDEALAGPSASGTVAGVLFLDLDSLKSVNDRYGHLVGDSLLVEIGERMATVLREEDLVARMGGDEFVCLLSAVHDTSDLAVIAQKVHRAIARPVSIREHHLSVSASIGATLVMPGDLAEDVIARADRGLYEAKRSGGNRIQLVDGTAVAGA